MTRAEKAVKELLEALGQDTTSEGLQETPRRMAAMLSELCTREEFKFTTFDSKKTSEMIIQSPIHFSSLCAHHCLPFVGTASVAYIPNGRIVGLSKLARAVAYCAKGLQTQEYITTAVADLIEEKLAPIGVGVILRARHLCMEMRGAKAHDTWTTTSCLRGAFLTLPEVRAEFMALTRAVSS